MQNFKTPCIRSYVSYVYKMLEKLHSYSYNYKNTVSSYLAPNKPSLIRSAAA